MLAARDLAVPARLAGVTLELRGGEVTAICGPNGAGKSTLLACLSGLLDGGHDAVTIGGVALDDMHPDERARLLGYLPQSPEVAWDVTVETLIGIGRLPWRGAPAGETAEAIARAIAAMDLEDLRQRPVSRLSGGERARVLLARVLAGEPRWLLADEPLANLDLAHAATLMARFKAEARSGRGVVVVLHDLAAAMNHADRVLVLDQGRIVADGPPQQALGEEILAQVWGVDAHWLGEAGARALAITETPLAAHSACANPV